MLDINGHDYSKAQDQTRLWKQRRPTDGITNLSILRFGWLRYLWLYLRTRVNRTSPELPEHAVASSLCLESCPPLKASLARIPRSYIRLSEFALLRNNRTTAAKKLFLFSSQVVNAG